MIIDVVAPFNSITFGTFSSGCNGIQPRIALDTPAVSKLAFGLKRGPARLPTKGPFKYYVIKDVGGWGQKMAIFDDLQYCKSSKRWVGGPKKVKNMMT